MASIRLILLSLFLVPICAFIALKIYNDLFPWTRNDIDLDYTTGKRAVITGASVGSIGFETALELAAAGVDVDVISRSKKRGEETVEALRQALLAAVDSTPDSHEAFSEQKKRWNNKKKNRFGSFDYFVADLQASPVDQVRKAAAAIKKKRSKLDVLILNAGIFSLSPYALSNDGKFESQIAVSYVAHYVLAAELMPLLLDKNNNHNNNQGEEEEEEARIVGTETLGTWFGSLENFTFVPSRQEYEADNMTKIKIHCNAKLALMSLLEQLRRKYGEKSQDENNDNKKNRKILRVVHSHPGMTRSRLLRDFKEMEGDTFHSIAQSTAAGAASLLRAAVDKDVDQSDFVAPNYAVRGSPIRGHAMPLKKSDASTPLYRDFFEKTKELTGVVWP